MGTCTSSKHYQNNENERRNQKQKLKTVEEIYNFRVDVVRSYIWDEQQSLNWKWKFTYFEEWITISNRIIDLVLNYYPPYQIYGIGRGLVGHKLDSFTKLPEFETLLYHKSALYKISNKYFITSHKSDLFGQYHDEDDSFISHFNQMHYNCNNNRTLSNFKQVSTFDTGSIDIISTGLFAKCMAVKLKNGRIYFSENIKLNIAQCRRIILQNITSISCGERHALFLSSNGTVYSMGGWRQGQLGMKMGASYSCQMWRESYPQTIDLFIQQNIYINHISCGAFHNCCLARDGKIFCFGGNEYNQCTFNFSELDIVDEPYYFEYFGNSNKMIQAECGRDSTIVLTEDYKCYAFGKIQNEPIEISDEKCVKRALLFSESNTKLKKMSVGDGHMIGVTLNGEIILYTANQMHDDCVNREYEETEEKIKILTNNMFPNLKSNSNVYHVVAGISNTIVVFH